ncbi:alpha/beta hydrolase domain-containing protein [Chelatococcus asaccharovorans]|uniref:alpha/beta hydrolase domain-containing protein n=1 Tax=Chelatococcus asaccharovorans TaxID=28210 RepID=UPI0022648F8E|nr:alpha/beta hydrolase domain-containing protein [Chelatococcus asaccharovorans]
MSGVVDLEIIRRRPFADGHAFGEAGAETRAYECIDARAHVAIDPQDPAYAWMIDIGLAERGGDGLVHVSTDLWILKPVALERGNGAAMVEFVNRGNKRALQFYNDGPASNAPQNLADAGNGFLMRRGYTVISAAWQGDVLPGDGRLVARLPVARHPDGPVTGRVRAEFIVETRGVTSLPLSAKAGTRPLPAASLDTGEAVLQRRRYPWSEAKALPADAWQFARVEGGGRGGQGDISGAEQGIVASDSHLYIPAGFEPGWIYELLYTARDPLVLDLGYAAMRDLVSFLKQTEGGANLLRADGAPPLRFYGWGRSQTGRGIRDFIHRGFNADAQGRKVFDGMLTHIAGGGRTTMNRFTNLVVAASRQYEDWLNPSDRFPFSYAMSTDHLTGAVDGILKRPETDPLVIHTQTASEYWYRRGSLVHTDTEGNDLPQPETVRVYFWASSQHWADPLATPPVQRGVCQNAQNIVATSAFFRATLEAMDAWVRDGQAPPPSAVPRRDDGTLVTMDAWRGQFPAIPGVALPARPNELPLVDYGPDFEAGAAIVEPPVVSTTQHYAVLVPAVDADGNDRAGLRAPMVAAPLGTYTGWNLRIPGHGTGALHDFSGSYIPLPETREEREVTGDPRPSILERYGTPAGYVAAIRAAAGALAERRFLLAEDVERAAEAARDWGRARHIVYLPAASDEA